MKYDIVQSGYGYYTGPLSVINKSMIGSQWHKTCRDVFYYCMCNDNDTVPSTHYPQWRLSTFDLIICVNWCHVFDEICNIIIIFLNKKNSFCLETITNNIYVQNILIHYIQKHIVLSSINLIIVNILNINYHLKINARAVFSYKLRYIVGFWLVEMAISTNQKPTIYRNLCENTGPGVPRKLLHGCFCFNMVWAR